MTEKNNNQEENVLDSYKYAHLAALYAQNKDVDKAGIALKEFAKENGLLNTKSEGLLEAIVTTPEATMKAAGIEGRVYAEKLAQTKVADLIGSKLEQYFKNADLKKAVEETKEGLDMTYNDFIKMLDKAQDVAKNKYGEASQEDINKAKATMNKYGLLYQILVREQEMTLQPLQANIDMIYLKRLAQEQYPVEKKEDKE